MTVAKTSFKLFTRRRVILGVAVIAVASTLVLLSNRFVLYDYVRLWHYKPSNTIAQLATDDTMTPYARKVYYVNHPVLESKAAFAPNCPSGTEQTVVLGCYHADQAGIYLLSVADTQLAGIEQVTAAHETLHAAYDRLSSSERTKVDAMLTNYYNHGLHDTNILATIAAYKKSEPNDVVNEMHSVFGTEAANLPPALESYYTRYFGNRMAIVADYTHYEAALTARVSQVAQDDAQLASWKRIITSEQTTLEAEAKALASQIATLDQQRSAGDIASYNDSVPGYNTALNNYDAGVSALQNLYVQYNQLVSTRNQLALEQQQLVQSIDDQAPAMQ